MQVGACIVGGRGKVILGIGYNGFPRGCPDDKLSWAKKSRRGQLGTKYPFVVHAEANALLNTNHADLNGACLYVTMFPCNECAKLLIQAGIKDVVFHEVCTPGKLAFWFFSASVATMLCRRALRAQNHDGKQSELFVHEAIK
jgi:deoxycytidylate deaminase